MSEKPFIDQIHDHVMGMQNALKTIQAGTGYIDPPYCNKAGMEAIEFLTRQLEEARGRIGELESELKQERLWKLTPDEHRDYLEARYKSVSHDLDLAAAREAAKDARIAELEAALTPSEETKFAYMGEVNFWHTDFDEDGNEHRIRLDVPWTSIKELMKLIREKAQRHRTAPEPPGAITEGKDG